MRRSLFFLAIILGLSAAPGCSGDKEEPEEMKKSGHFLSERSSGNNKTDAPKQGGRLPRPRGR